MSDTHPNTNVNGPEPLVNHLNPMVFWIVTGVLTLAIAVTFILVKKDIADAREDFKTAMLTQMAAQEKKTNDSIEVASQRLNAEIALLKETNAKLDSSLKSASTDLVELTKRHDTFLKSEFPAYKTKQDEALASKAGASELTATNVVVNKVETQVKYLTERVSSIESKMGSIETTMKDLAASGTEMRTELKKEHEELRREVEVTTKDHNATREQLLKLENKTTEFQLKLMQEKAKKAVEALRKKDLKGTLDFLDAKN